MKPTFRLPDSSPRLGTGVFPSGNVVPSRDGGIFAGNAVPHREAIFFSQEMPSRIGKAFFLPGNAAPNREAVFFVRKCRPESGGHFFHREGSSRIGTLFFHSRCVPHYCSAPVDGWAAGLKIKVNYRLKCEQEGTFNPACPII